MIEMRMTSKCDCAASLPWLSSYITCNITKNSYLKGGGKGGGVGWGGGGGWGVKEVIDVM